MAFEIPAHLPRAIPQDKPIQVLTELGQTTNKALHADLVASWVAELDLSIKDTKSRISRRINEDLPEFERQHKASLSVQRRLLELSNTADGLSDALNNPNTGILPTLLRSLMTHNVLRAQAKESHATSLALDYLSQLRDQVSRLSTEVSQGKLPSASQTCTTILKLITDAPAPLERTNVMADIGRRFRILNDTVQDQLNNAYARSVMFSGSLDSLTLTIMSSTTAGREAMPISLSDIMASLSSEFLLDHLSTLRRNILSKIVEPVLKSSCSLEISSSESSAAVTVSSASPLTHPLQSLRSLSTFFYSHFFPYLPPNQSTFHTTLHIPISTSILTHLVKPSLPTSIQSLPSYLQMLVDAVQFEEELFSLHTQDRPVRDWADNVANHYEKKRREDFLEKARAVVIKPEDGSTFKVVIDLEPSTPHPVLFQEKTQPPESESDDSSTWDEAASGWGFEETNDEEVEVATAESPIQQPASPPSMQQSTPSSLEKADEEEGDGWDWEDEVNAENSTAASDRPMQVAIPPSKAPEGDSPRGSDGWSIDSELSQHSDLDRKPKFPASAPTPKLATRLERFSAKAKGGSTPTPVGIGQKSSGPAQPSPQSFQHNFTAAAPAASGVKPQKTPMPFRVKGLKESYLVSTRVRQILTLAEHALHEGEELLTSNVYAAHRLPGTLTPGQLLTTASSILDLYRALYPIAHSSSLQSPTLRMRWSNECSYLSKEVGGLKRKDGSLDVRWAETAERLQTLADLNFENAIMIEQETVQNILGQAGGFVDLSRSDQYMKCRDVLESTLQEINEIAKKWKEILTRSNYLRSIGLVVDAALFRIMDDVLSLQDIPEADSERLSELCETFDSLQNLFAYGTGDQSVVGSYVPLWFKFSYLPWLIKGSIADISYLFDEGMLIDYEINELVRLVRALFAETPLRENTIAKFMRGHPSLTPEDGS